MKRVGFNNLLYAIISLPGKKAHRLCCCMVKDEIMIGPITTSMLLFEDFLTYKSGKLLKIIIIYNYMVFTYLLK